MFCRLVAVVCVAPRRGAKAAAPPATPTSAGPSLAAGSAWLSVAATRKWRAVCFDANCSEARAAAGELAREVTARGGAPELLGFELLSRAAPDLALLFSPAFPQLFQASPVAIVLADAARARRLCAQLLALDAHGREGTATLQERFGFVEGECVVEFAGVHPLAARLGEGGEKEEEGEEEEEEQEEEEQGEEGEEEGEDGEEQEDAQPLRIVTEPPPSDTAHLARAARSSVIDALVGNVWERSRASERAAVAVPVDAALRPSLDGDTISLAALQRAPCVRLRGATLRGEGGAAAAFAANRCWLVAAAERASDSGGAALRLSAEGVARLQAAAAALYCEGLLNADAAGQRVFAVEETEEAVASLAVLRERSGWVGEAMLWRRGDAAAFFAALRAQPAGRHVFVITHSEVAAEIIASALGDAQRFNAAALAAYLTQGAVAELWLWRHTESGLASPLSRLGRVLAHAQARTRSPREADSETERRERIAAFKAEARRASVRAQ